MGKEIYTRGVLSLWGARDGAREDSYLKRSEKGRIRVDRDSEGYSMKLGTVYRLGGVDGGRAWRG